MGRDTVSAADPLTRFEAEHREALSVLDKLERAADALESGESPEPHLRTMREALAFLSTEVRAHNDAEERALFCCFDYGALTTPFEDEHRRLRILERALGVTLAAADAGSWAPGPARELVWLLRDHIEREDTVLFPMARHMLGAEGLAAVARRLSG